MKKYFILHVTALLSIQIAIAQSVGIGTASPNASARLDIKSTTQGILIPTLTSAQRNAIINPAIGLLVFQTDGTQGFYYYSGVSWLSLANGHQPNSEGIAVSTSYGLTTTFAGSGTPGAANGIGTAASFSIPNGVAVDASGNVYVADSDNNRIRKITAAGVVSTFAGTGFGDTDGDTSIASFNFPVAVAVDVSGNVYVVDRDNMKIRKITAAGVVSTLAGDGFVGSDDGPANTASFNFPQGLAVDASGNVYVADKHSHKIRKISGGVVSTFAGNGIQSPADGIGAAASFNNPSGIAIDASGNIYVADRDNHKIRKIKPNGDVTTLAGSAIAGSADGIGTAASFNSPIGIAVDASGNVYVADEGNLNIRKITPAGVVTTLAGNGAINSIDGIGTAASFNQPGSVAVDASGNVYVAENLSHKIRKIIAQ